MEMNRILFLTHISFNVTNTMTIFNREEEKESNRYFETPNLL